MSKLREIPRTHAEELESPSSVDLRPYVVFTQLKKGGPYLYAGWLDATDDDMALAFAKEHYGQDQECVNVHVIWRENLTSSDGLYTAARPDADRFHVFTQKKPGDLWISAGVIDATSSQSAIDEARKSIRQAKSAHCVWVAATDRVISSDGDLIWRQTDQSYRLARGYGREVRAKWIAIRDEKQLEEYEKEDLKESF